VRSFWSISRFICALLPIYGIAFWLRIVTRRECPDGLKLMSNLVVANPISCCNEVNEKRFERVRSKLCYRGSTGIGPRPAVIEYLTDHFCTSDWNVNWFVRGRVQVLCFVLRGTFMHVMKQSACCVGWLVPARSFAVQGMLMAQLLFKELPAVWGTPKFVNVCIVAYNW